MDILYFMKIQNAADTKTKRERELAAINREMSNHFEDTYDTEEVLINGVPKLLMIIKDSDSDGFKKKIKSRHDDKFNLGDYVIWNNQHWIITSIDPDEKTWNRGYMCLCIIPLRWQNQDGEIVERFAYSEDFSKYSVGISSNSVITVGENQYGLLLPIDNETKKLKRDMRFPIDFGDTECPDIYKLTNRKVSLNNSVNFSRGGIMTITLNYDYFNKNEDKLVSYGNEDVWICNYRSPTSELPDPLPNPDNIENVNAYIDGKDELKIGFPRKYDALFIDKSGNAITGIDFKWNVISEFDVSSNQQENTIELCVDNENFVGCSFILQILSIDDNVMAEMIISVVDGF